VTVVSVIVPCFNHARFLPEAVASILSQSHSDLELILVDDCSSDNSWDLMKSFAAKDHRVKAVRHEYNQGLPTTRNDGLRIAKGAFIAFCDSDDVWETRKVETQLRLLRSHPDYDMVYCETLIIDEHGTPTGERFSDPYPLPTIHSGWLFPQLLRGNFINVQSALMRRRCLDSVGHFDKDLRVLEDWWYWVQLSRRHRFLFHPEPLARYRVHGQSMNAMKTRSFPVTRVKLFRRLLDNYPDLDLSAKAHIAYVMGVDLCTLGKYRVGRRMLWNAVRLSVADAKAFDRFIKAIVRLLLTFVPLSK
jgi:glycosyltransferase involved in cell wall biosynthesis